jgi:sulfhydrogenase subunit alpha
MKVNLSVDVHHLARVEGHGNIKVRVKDGKLEAASWQVVETPRYFEVMLKGKHYSTAGILTARICGICSIGHCLASLRATESAFGMQIPEAAAKLRLLAKHGETLQSHYLHLFFLVVPDLVGQASVLPLLEASPESVQLALRLKGLANRLCDAVAGRTTHPVSLQVGGVAQMPPQDVLLSLRDELERSLEGVQATANLFRGFKLPDFSRETEFVSLQGNGAYPFIGGSLVSTDGVVRAEYEYLAMTNEYVVPDNTSKWCRLSRKSFAVGALARFNNNHQALHPEAQRVAGELGLRPVCHNPFMNNVAQLVECVHATYDSIRLIDELVDAGPAETMTPATPRAGEGVGAVEVPRGILYHDVQLDAGGTCIKANCVIPTGQNLANIDRDLAARVPQILDRPREAIAADLEMLVRAYDPCISCSAHFLDVEFVGEEG